MTSNNYILFCESPLESNVVDPDFQEEFECAKQCGFKTLLFNFEDLTEGNPEKAARKIRPTEITAQIIYRGWMLTPFQYSQLYEILGAKNYKLINSPLEYQNCHYLPDSLLFIEANTPKTVFEKLGEKENLQSILNQASIFGTNPVIIKDFVKSEKHDWETACFVNNAADRQKLQSTLENFIRLRGKYLNEGIVIREFIELNELTIHSKSGMPLTEEYRLFFCSGELLGIYEYWEEGDYTLPKPDTAIFETIAKNIRSNFFSMDIARKKSGELIIIELGDGQVAGLPDRLNKIEFYEKLHRCCC